MSTIADIASWVTGSMLNRSDMTSQVQQFALDMYLAICQAVPFDELMVTSQEIPTRVYVNPGDERYDISNLVPALRGIQNIRMTFDSTNKRRLRRSSVRTYDALSISPATRPATYARWGLNIEFNPPPNSNLFTFRIRYWSKPLINRQNFAQTKLQIPEDWEILLKFETLYLALYAIGQSERAQALIQSTPMMRQQGSPRKQRMFEMAILPRLWNDLLKTISQHESPDEDFSVNPIVRAYSYRG